MKLLLILAADHANITSDGKLNVMGIFREINAFNFPARHSSMHLVIKLGAEPGEPMESRTMTVKLLDADGKELLNVSGPANLPRSEKGRLAEFNAILELKDTVFPHPGPYQFVVLVDNNYKGELTIYTNKVEPPGQGAPSH